VNFPEVELRTTGFDEQIEAVVGLDCNITAAAEIQNKRL
jgi:hypothetical protein